MNNIKKQQCVFIILCTLPTSTNALFKNKKKSPKKYSIQNQTKEKSHKKSSKSENAKPEKIIGFDFLGNLRTDYYEETSKIKKTVTNILTGKIMVYYRDGKVTPFK